MDWGVIRKGLEGYQREQEERKAELWDRRDEDKKEIHTNTTHLS